MQAKSRVKSDMRDDKRRKTVSRQRAWRPGMRGDVSFGNGAGCKKATGD